MVRFRIMSSSYSKDFQGLLNPPEKLKDLLINCSFSGTFEAWEQRKAFIASATHKDGSFLDIGCGNGFLIKCLQEWSEHTLIPYGIDINTQYVEIAKELFPKHQQNFTVLDINNISNLTKNLPGQYDFVFYSNNWSQNAPYQREVERINSLVEYVNPGGRLIIGFYSQNKDNNLQAVEALQSLGIKFSEVLHNPHDTNLVAWVDKRSAI